MADGAEFLAMGAGNLEVCTAAMTYGFRVVTEMVEGLKFWMDSQGHPDLAAVQGRAAPNFAEWQHLNLNYGTKARIDEHAYICCGSCFAAC